MTELETVCIEAFAKQTTVPTHSLVNYVASRKLVSLWVIHGIAIGDRNLEVIARRKCRFAGLHFLR